MFFYIDEMYSTQKRNELVASVANHFYFIHLNDFEKLLLPMTTKTHLNGLRREHKTFLTTSLKVTNKLHNLLPLPHSLVSYAFIHYRLLSSCSVPDHTQWFKPPRLSIATHIDSSNQYCLWLPIPYPPGSPPTNTNYLPTLTLATHTDTGHPH